MDARLHQKLHEIMGLELKCLDFSLVYPTVYVYILVCIYVVNLPICDYSMPILIYFFMGDTRTPFCYISLENICMSFLSMHLSAYFLG